MKRQPSLFPALVPVRVYGSAAAPTATLPLDLPALSPLTRGTCASSGPPPSWPEDLRKTMQRICTEMSGGDTLPGADIGTRWRAALRSRYPQHASKGIQADFDVDPRTADGWLGGQAPHLKHFVRAVELHGPPFAAELLLPGTDWHAATDLAARLDELRSGLDEVADRLARLRR